MPLVPNYISRLRTHSQSTDTSANTATDSRFTDPITDTSLTTNTSLHPIAELDQKVLSNSDTSLEETTFELNTEEHTGPTLPRHKVRLPKHLAVKSRADMPIEQVGPTVNADAASPPSSPRSPLLSRILPAPLRGGARAQSNSPSDFEKEESIPEGGQTSWATFGRRLPGMPRLGEFGSFHGRESKSKSSSRRSKQASTSHGHSRAQTLESQSASPAGTVSSSSISQSHSRRHTLPDQIPDIEPESSHDHSLSYHTSQSHVDPVTPKHSMPFPDGVPNTFGRGTSRAPPLSGQEDASNDAFSPTRTSTPPPPERLARRSPPGTYPQRSRKRSSPTVGSVSFPTLPRRSSKPSFSRTRADDIFQVRHSPAPKRKGRESDPIQKDERNAPRQPGADLFARQVISDLGPDDSLDSSWAAGVSREIVRLSLALSGTGGSQVQLPVEIEEARKERERAEIGIVSQDEDGGKNPTLFGSVGEDRKAFLRAAQMRTGSGVLQATSAEESSQASGSSSTPGARRGVPRVSAVTTRPLSSFNTRLQTFSDPGPSPSSSSAGILSMFEPPTSSGKRKMAVESQEDVTLKEPKGILVHRRDSKLPSDASHAPSSFRQPKRIRLSTPTHNPASISRPSSPPSRPSSSLRSHTGSPALNSRRLSQTSLASSLPVRAIVSPKPPSIDRSSAGTAYHMRDPNLPPSRRHSTQWTGAARRRWGDEEWGGFGGIGGKRGTYFPFQGWAFVLGFILFPLWWIAALVPVRWGRVREREQPQDGRGLPLWETDEEKVARETVGYDVAYTWRKRCRIMSVVGLFIYVPLIVLLGVLIPRTS